jgi:hypothetical protein
LPAPIGRRLKYPHQDWSLCLCREALKTTAILISKTDKAFEVLDLPAERRLADADLSRRPREIKLLGDS